LQLCIAPNEVFIADFMERVCGLKTFAISATKEAFCFHNTSPANGNHAVV